MSAIQHNRFNIDGIHANALRLSKAYHDLGTVAQPPAQLRSPGSRAQVERREAGRGDSGLEGRREIIGTGEAT